ncbi:MAG: hypothetical protein FWD96_03935 [Defluviitaleaceae bacterium]|nr:hypothetical protein [Defluviitaleaceae bacterium]
MAINGVRGINGASGAYSVADRNRYNSVTHFSDTHRTGINSNPNAGNRAVSTGAAAERNRYNSAASASDMQMYERMTSLITTSPSRNTQNANTALTNGGQNIILNNSSGVNHSRDMNNIGLMSARNQLADTNIARASIVGNRNSIVNQYQDFMRQGAHSTAKRVLNTIG